MNQLEAQQLIEEAQQYIGKTVYLYPYDQTTFNRVKLLCRYDGKCAVMELSEAVEISDGVIPQKGKINVQVTAKMIIVNQEPDYLPYGLKSVIRAFKEQETTDKK